MSALDIDLLDYLRLEVETDPTGLVNLVANPSGLLGGWGWVTPVAGSAMSSQSNGTRLRYTAQTPAGASWFYTENMPVAAGQYVAASWLMEQSFGTGGFYRARFEYLDAGGAVLSSSAQTGYLTVSGTPQNLGPLQAPASTVYVRLRFDLYSTNAGANPSAGAWIQLRQVTVAKAAAAASLGALRVNLIQNPSMETNAGLWYGGGTLTRSTTFAQVGAASLRNQAPAVGAPGGYTFQTNIDQPVNPITGGKAYTLSGYLRAGATARTWTPTIYWYNSVGSLLYVHTLPNAASAVGSWTRFSGTVVAPVGAAQAMVLIDCPTWVAAELHYLDAVLLEQTDTLGTYFDGSTAAAGGWTYQWTGTAHASPSNALSSNLAYVEPVPFVGILSGSVAIDINRPALDVGVLQALIKDATLDPATATLLRPGRTVRALALNATTAAWDVLYTGTLDKARVTYDLTKRPEKQATITLAANDANQDLANTNRPDGVGTIAALPYVLEGARVPWNVDGSGNQVAAATVASRNDQASALDQVVLARDSVSGYAWVTKEGVLTAYTNRTLDYYGTGTALVDEAVYSGLDVTFDSADCINEVLVNYRRFNSTTQEVEEVTFGPYRDAASISTWGVHQKTFTVHGMAEATVPAFAAAILAANATPARRINGVVIPIRAAADITRTKALLDLYAKVRVKNTDKALDQTLRPTGIRHKITPHRWTMELSFESAGDTVAAPVPTTPQGESGGILEGVWTNLALLNSWANFGSSYANAKYMRKGGVTYLNGLIKSGANDTIIAVLPVGCRPAADAIFNANIQGRTTSLPDTGAVTAHRHTLGFVACRVTIKPNGEVSLANHSTAVDTGYLSLAGICFPAEL